MEILRGTAPKVRFDHPTADTTVTSFKVAVDGGSPISKPFTSTGLISAGSLPYISNQNSIVVTWEFTIASEPYSKSETYRVVQPYLSLTDLRKLGEDLSDEELFAGEAVVRHIINSYCGQSFASETKTVKVLGRGDDFIELPERLYDLDGVSTLTATLDPNAFAITGDGKFLRKGHAEELSEIASDDKYFDGYDVTNTADPGEPGYIKYSHGPVIHAPGHRPTATHWLDDYPFFITGSWGYEVVPAPVVEAAKILFSDYACNDSTYRDRYVQAIRAADWRIDFSARAWESTGNAKADQLLSDYVVTKIGII